MDMVSIMDNNKRMYCTQKENKHYSKYLNLFSIKHTNFANPSQQELFQKKYFVKQCNWFVHSISVH